MENDFFALNLKKISNIYSQRKIASDTSFSPASVNNYISGASEPSLAFLLALKNAYNINIDDFVSREVDFYDKNRLDNPVNKRFVGNYLMYYYNSGAYKGRVNDYSKSTINYAIISICGGNSMAENTLKVYGVFTFNKEQAEEKVKELNAMKSSDEIDKFYSTLDDKYDGNFEKTNEHFFIKLRNKENNDHCFLIFNNPPSLSSYIGGLGTCNSVSRGREHMPCIQYVLLSRQILSIPEGEIYNLLSLGISDMNVNIETDKLIELFKNLYLNQNEFTNTLSDYQKKKIVNDSLSNMLQDVVNANMFRFAKISDSEDDKYYRIIKNEENYDDNNE
jgi:transcriptional regulator with XRE-family HTH domain